MILGLVVAALAGKTADEELFDSFISPDPIPFAPPRTPLPTPLYPRRWPEVGVLAAAGASAAGGGPPAVPPERLHWSEVRAARIGGGGGGGGGRRRREEGRESCAAVELLGGLEIGRAHV